MTNGAAFIPGVIVGGALVYWLGLGEPDYISLMREQVKDGAGTAYGLHKLGSGQVAVIHGFWDDLEVCDMFKERLEVEGGLYSCEPITE